MQNLQLPALLNVPCLLNIKFTLANYDYQKTTQKCFRNVSLSFLLKN